MIYEIAGTSDSINQGDIISQCPLIYWLMERRSDGILERLATVSHERVVVLTQSCDLANDKTTNVQIAVAHEARRLVELGLLKEQTIRDQVRRHRVFGWYFLPAGQNQPESIVDFRDIHTVPRALLLEQISKGYRSVTIKSPYREHMAQHFAVTFSRIALPEPYETLDDRE